MKILTYSQGSLMSTASKLLSEKAKPLDGHAVRKHSAPEEATCRCFAQWPGWIQPLSPRVWAPEWRVSKSPDNSSSQLSSHSWPYQSSAEPWDVVRLKQATFFHFLTHRTCKHFKVVNTSLNLGMVCYTAIITKYHLSIRLESLRVWIPFYSLEPQKETQY